MTVWQLILIIFIWQAGGCVRSWYAYKRDVARMRHDSLKQREHVEALFKIQEEQTKRYRLALGLPES